MVSEQIEAFVLKTTGAESIDGIEEIQSLWSGYGSIKRYFITGYSAPSIIVKHVQPPDASHHPRGWNTHMSHERKLKSYEVETHWYQHYASRCSDNCYLPHCLGFEGKGTEVLLLLEDLDASGFDKRKTSVSLDDMFDCIDWLAHFHATFLGVAPDGLWQVGTYWHLDTRPDELNILQGEDPVLHNAAREIDNQLSGAKFLTLVHGDAKLANFCFSSQSGTVSHTPKPVSAVDFQYAGGGCGMKDLAYFIGSCLREADCERYESELLKRYFDTMRSALNDVGQSEIADELEKEWRALFPVAWADFHRFLKGWSPGHWKLNSYSERLAKQVIDDLGL